MKEGLTITALSTYLYEEEGNQLARYCFEHHPGRPVGHVINFWNEI